MIAATTADGVASSNQEIPGPDAVGSRSAVEALPIRYPTDTLGLREPLPIRYRSRARPEHASRARPDRFCQQSCG